MIKDLGEKEITLKETTKEGIEAGKEIKCLVKVVLDEEQQLGETKIILQNSEDEKSLELTVGISYPAAMFKGKCREGLIKDLTLKIGNFLQEKAIGSIKEDDQFTELHQSGIITLHGSGNTCGDFLRYTNNLATISKAVDNIIDNAE